MPRPLRTCSGNSSSTAHSRRLPYNDSSLPDPDDMRQLHQKLGARRRSVAVEQARALGLLASSARRP
ncbi:MAG TPA: hypothetical protein VGI96_19295 [Streptosporangiaceae bacterium]